MINNSESDSLFIDNQAINKQSSYSPLISIVTVTKNLIRNGREKSFEIAIDCIQNQTFRKIEHIVVDGASDDGTQKIILKAIKKYTEESKSVPIKYNSEPDLGLYDAMNKAVNIAKGQYIMFLNSDDTLAGPDVVEKIKALINVSFPDFIYGTHIMVDTCGKEQEFLNVKLAAFLQRMPFCHNSMVVQKDIFEKLGGHDLNYPVAADHEFVFKMLSTGYQGKFAKFPISVFKSGGISSDVTACANDSALFWSKFFYDLGLRFNWSHSDYVRWYQIGQIPLKACWYAFRKGQKKSLLRKAAVHSALITIRRRIQPWRSWDNLKS